LLFVDDDADDLELCLKGLRRSGMDFLAVSVSTREDFSRALRENTFDVVVSDFRMKGWTGIDALSMVNKVCSDVPVILLSGTLGEELAVDCIKMGVTDYVLKHQLARLPIALNRAREERSLREGGRRKPSPPFAKAKSDTARWWRMPRKRSWSSMPTWADSSIATTMPCVCFA
jgi:DNA-binding NtrC family response regulator